MLYDMTIVGKVFVIVCVGIVLSGCSFSERSVNVGKSRDVSIIAERISNGQIRIDGMLKERVWKMTTYSLVKAESGDNSVLAGDTGVVSVLCDDENIYVGGIFKERDVICKSTKDAQKHYKKGDVCEIFIKPANKNWYWEIWVTPKGYKIAVLWILFNDGTKEIHLYYTLGMEAAGHVMGTINKSDDVDEGWSFEIQIPIKRLRFPIDIVAEGDRGIDVSNLRMLIARQDFTKYVDLRHRQLSSYPQLSEENFHLYKEYAKFRCCNVKR